MIFSHTKPLNYIEAQFQYRKHKIKLQSIENAPVHMAQTNPMISFKKNHHRSVSFHQHQVQDKIHKQNEKMLNRLLEISHRKKQFKKYKANSSLSGCKDTVRKQREKMITENNYQLAVRLLNNRSQFDPNKIKKQIKEYQQLKKTLYNNRKITMLQRIRTAYFQDHQQKSRNQESLDKEKQHSHTKKIKNHKRPQRVASL